MTESLYVAQPFTPNDAFTNGIEGPACDKDGNLYAVNYARQHTIGKLTPHGEGSIFIELPNGSIGNGIRFHTDGTMFIADYTNHNVLKVDMTTRAISVHAHNPTMNQPNDICIVRDGTIYASDPNWREETGQIWRADTNGELTLLETGMGTTNGIEISPDERTLYVNQSVQRNIWAYDRSLDGTLTNKRLFIQFPDFGLDGMRCDMDGNLYTTRFGKGVIAKLSPSGELLREITLHGANCTNLTFGGLDGRTCYVTVADTGAVESFRVETPGRCWWLLHQ